LNRSPAAEARDRSWGELSSAARRFLTVAWKAAARPDGAPVLGLRAVTPNRRAPESGDLGQDPASRARAT
jgi:hypothetical protein